VARKKTPQAAVRQKHTLSERIAALRAEVFGDRGGPELARRLGLPIRTWYNYEGGVTVPAQVVLKIIELASVEPMWLLHGRGPKYRSGSHTNVLADDVAPDRSVAGLLRASLQLLESGAPTGSAGEMPGEGLQVKGNAMAPIVADGAFVAVATNEETPEQLDGKVVVAYIDGQPVVRWFRYHGQFARLWAEKPDTGAPEIVIDLTESPQRHVFRRVVQINTPH
jgi:hypothetical protein